MNLSETLISTKGMRSIYYVDPICCVVNNQIKWTMNLIFSVYEVLGSEDLMCPRSDTEIDFSLRVLLGQHGHWRKSYHQPAVE